MENNDKDRNWDWKINKQYFYSPTRSQKKPGYIGSYAMDNMAMSLNTVYNTTNFRDALIRIVNIRGDSDSVGSVVGQIAGASYPIEDIPGDWIKEIYKWDRGEIALRGYMLARLKEGKSYIIKKERQKRTEEENLKKIELQQSEKIRLNYVFNQLCELENEKSSDDDSKSKKYLRAINEKAKKKQMKIEKPKYKSNFEKANKKKYKNKDEEDEEEKEKKPPKKKFSQKALRKVIRKLCNEFAKDELANMIWEVDENLDGYVSEEEFENMYKKCITDENEEE